MKGIFVTALLVLIGYQFASSQKTKALPTRADTIYVFSKDTVVVNRVDPEIIKQYSEILEKTNNQLGLWTNPYGLMVGVLSALVALITIIAAYRIFRQSRDYQTKIDSEINTFRSKIDEEIRNSKATFNDEINSFRAVLQKEFLDNKQAVESYLEELSKAMLENIQDKSSPLFTELASRIEKLEKTKADGRPVVWKATYGYGDRFADVTTIVKILVHTGVSFYATNEALGSDPIPGTKKVLDVEYSFGNVIYKK